MPKLRDATVEDAELLCAAERQTALVEGLLLSDPDELNPSNIKDKIGLVADGRGKYLVAEQAGVIVGHACLWPLPLRRLSHVVVLSICVHPGHVRCGYGRALMSALIDWARKHPDVHKIELMTRAHNLPAIALYASLGFAEEGRLRQRLRLNNGTFADDLCLGLAVL